MQQILRHMSTTDVLAAPGYCRQADGYCFRARQMWVCPYVCVSVSVSVHLSALSTLSKNEHVQIAGAANGIPALPRIRVEIL